MELPTLQLEHVLTVNSAEVTDNTCPLMLRFSFPSEIQHDFSNPFR